MDLYCLDYRALEKVSYFQKMMKLCIYMYIQRQERTRPFKYKEVYYACASTS